MFFTNPQISELLKQYFINPNIMTALGSPFCSILENKVKQKLKTQPETDVAQIIKEIANEEVNINLKKLTEDFIKKHANKNPTILEQEEFNNKKYSYLKNAAILYRLVDNESYKALLPKLHKSKYFSNLVKEAFTRASLPRASLQFTGISKTLSSHSAITQKWKIIADLALAEKRKDARSVVNYKKTTDVEAGAEMLTSAERQKYAIMVSEGALVDLNHSNFDTRNYISHKKKGYAAFVINTEGEISVFNHLHGENALFHSSLNAGKAVLGAGEIKVVDGKLKSISQYSGHYEPTLENTLAVLTYLKKQSLDISEVEVFLLNKIPLTNQLKLSYSLTNGTHIYKATDLLTHAVSLEKYAMISSIVISSPPHFDPAASRANLHENSVNREILMQLNSSDRGLFLGLSRICRQLLDDSVKTPEQLIKIKTSMSQVISHYKESFLERVKELEKALPHDEASLKILKEIKHDIAHFNFSENLFSMQPELEKLKKHSLRANIHPLQLQMELVQINLLESKIEKFTSLTQNITTLEMSVGNFHYVPPPVLKNIETVEAMRIPFKEFLTDMETQFSHYSKEKLKISSSKNDVVRIELVSYLEGIVKFKEMHEKISLADTPEKIQNLALVLRTYYDNVILRAEQVGIGKYKEGNLSHLLKDFNTKLTALNDTLDNPEKLLIENSSKNQLSATSSATSFRRGS